MRYYDLDPIDGTIIPIGGIEEFLAHCKTEGLKSAGSERFHLVSKKDDVTVSTVFMYINHAWTEDEPPVLFETLVFNGPHDGDQKRYCTMDEAIRGHKRMVKRVLGKATIERVPY